MSPLFIMVLLNVYTSREAQWYQEQNIGSWGEAFVYFESMDAIKRNVKYPCGWEITEKGNAWVAAICNTPEPKQQWIDPRTGEPLEIL